MIYINRRYFINQWIKWGLISGLIYPRRPNPVPKNKDPILGLYDSDDHPPSFPPTGIIDRDYLPRGRFGTDVIRINGVTDGIKFFDPLIPGDEARVRNLLIEECRKAQTEVGSHIAYIKSWITPDRPPKVMVMMSEGYRWDDVRKVPIDQWGD